MTGEFHICFVSLQARGALVDQPGQKIGGAEQQIGHLARFCAAQPGVRVTLLVEDAGQPDRELAAGVELLKIRQPPEAPGALSRARRKMLSGLRLYRLVRAIGAHVVVQRAAGIETGLCCHAAHAAAARFVYMCASDSEFEPRYATAPGLLPRLFRHGVRYADLVLAQHPAQQQLLTQVYQRAAEVQRNVFPFTLTRELARAAPRLLWVGRCRAIKRPDLFIELARRLPDLPATLIAAPAEGDAPYFEQIASGARAAPNLEFIPGLPPAATRQQFARASLHINTSDYEGMPNTFLEAAEFGAVNLALHVDPEGLLTAAAAGFCARGDFEALLNATRRLATDEAARLELAVHAREVLAARHALDQVGPRFLSRLRTLCGYAAQATQA